MCKIWRPPFGGGPRPMAPMAPIDEKALVVRLTGRPLFGGDPGPMTPIDEKALTGCSHCIMINALQ